VIIDLDRIRDAVVHPLPFPYFALAGSMFPIEAVEAAKAFPHIGRAGAVSIEDTIGGPAFDRLIEELRSDEFRALIGEKLDVDLTGKDIVINARGRTRVSDGNIHTDTPTKLVTVLLYFNQPGEGGDTALRILNGPNSLDDFVEEVPPTLGSMLAFKVTPNCWHGHKPYSGERRSLQLNYLSGIERSGKHEGGRRFWSHLKRRIGLT
jgi:SM-20-related protein